MSSHRVIKAEHVMLALVGRKISGIQVRRGDRGSRWAAMSDGVNTQDCDRRRGAWHLPCPPLLIPLNNGRMSAVVERTRLIGGLKEVRRTWGCGLRAIQAEVAKHCLSERGAE